MKKRIIIASAIVIGGLATVVGTAGVTNAASAAGTAHAGIIRRINDERGRVRLNQAVRDGTITAAQKTAFENEVKTLRTERKAAISSSSTQAGRQAERDKLKTELKTWATTNNFPLAKIFPKLAG